MSQASAIRASKLDAMQGYVNAAAEALSMDDTFGWRSSMESLMQVVGSEVAVYGGVVPTFRAAIKTGAGCSATGPLMEHERHLQERIDDLERARDSCSPCSLGCGTHHSPHEQNFNPECSACCADHHSPHEEHEGAPSVGDLIDRAMDEVTQ